MIVSKISYSKPINTSKFKNISEQAKFLGNFRTEIWHRFGSINSTNLTDRKIRDQFLRENISFPVLANTWKETLRDTIADIKANMEAAKEKVRRHINKKFTSHEKKKYYKLLSSDGWKSNNYLSRLMRKYWIHGKNHTFNQIIVRSDNYTTFVSNKTVWVKIPSLVKGKRIAIPLTTSYTPKGTLRIILKDNKIEVHYPTEIVCQNDCGDKIIGIDKGYTDTFIDSEGDFHGKNLGKLLSGESDYLKKKYQNRNKLRSIIKNNSEKKSKINNIIKNNLGRKKLNERKRKHTENVRYKINKAVHSICDKAKDIAVEDLTFTSKLKSYGKNQNRRLSGWVKGILNGSLNIISQRRGSTLHYVNAAYTSQVDSRYGILLGERKGKKFYCFDRVVLDADINAARNVLARLYDSEIGRWTSYKKVKSILLKRTESYRLGLLNLDSSCTKKLVSTESELL